MRRRRTDWRKAVESGRNEIGIKRVEETVKNETKETVKNEIEETIKKRQGADIRVQNFVRT